MNRTGTLSVSAGVSRLDGTRMARAGANNPLAAATNFLAIRGLDDGDFIRIEGSDGTLGNVPVIFITSAALAAAALAANKAARSAKGRAKKAASSGRKRSAKKRATKSSAKKAGGRKSTRAKGSTKKSTGKKSRKGKGK